MSPRKGREEQRRVYVGNLHHETRVKDLDEVFQSYGKILDINLITGKGTYVQKPFAFITFEDHRDARDAIDYRDGYTLLGRKLRVEFTYAEGDSWRNRTEDRYRRTSHLTSAKFRVIVTGLPESASWQDLKDHMRSAGDISHSDVFKDGSGLVAYYNRKDMEYAIRKFDDTKFHSHNGDFSYIRVRAQSEEKSRSPSMSRSRSPANRRREARSRRESPVRHSSPPENRRRRR